MNTVSLLDQMADKIERATGCKVTRGDVDDASGAIVFDVRPSWTDEEERDISIMALRRIQDVPGRLVYTIENCGEFFRLHITPHAYRIEDATPEFTAHYIASGGCCVLDETA